MSPSKRRLLSLQPRSNSSSGEGGKKMSSTRCSKRLKENDEPVVSAGEEEVDDEAACDESTNSDNPDKGEQKTRRRVAAPRRKAKDEEDDSIFRFTGNPVDSDQANQRWPHRYKKKLNKSSKQVASTSRDTNDKDEEFMQAKCHYLQAEVDDHIYNLNDNAHVQAEDGKPFYICKIVELFEGTDGLPYFTAQWYYRIEDTVVGKFCTSTETKRVFFSEVKDDNPLDCLVEKLNIVKVSPNADMAAKLKGIPNCDYYYDMHYLLPFSTFLNATTPPENVCSGSDSVSTISSDADIQGSDIEEACCKSKGNQISEYNLLDLYSGCGGMSTGLCHGAKLHGLNLVTRWAVDYNKFACESVRINHPETQVRNEKAEDFLDLLKEWEKLCVSFSLVKGLTPHEAFANLETEDADDGGNEEDEDQDEDDSEVFEVEQILEICYGNPNNQKKRGLYFKVRWKGYGPDEDTWEPVEGLSDCQEKIKEFVISGFRHKILPLPGDTDVICGGPPCQGISGFNRFRDKENPLEGDKNKQIQVFMDVVEYLKPRYVLMENVSDLLKFADGFLGGYSLGRLVNMNYQARMGLLVAGAYGLPQFRMRVFIWGAQPTEVLPKYPLPTHDVVKRGGAPVAFESNVVAYDEGQNVQLKEKLFLSDAISDLPEVGNYETREEIPYGRAPQTDFQRFIRLKKNASPGTDADDPAQLLKSLFDHIPLRLNNDDYQRVCHIPKEKGANFRNLPGVRVGPNNVVEWDPDVERKYLPSGKPLVPDYAMTFMDGRSTKPFGRLWWDETVPTVVTRAEPHNQVILHPVQDRVLTVRENARLQGFPDYYKLMGPTKQKYIQVGNAVAVPVARALGYALSMATQGFGGYEPLFTLPSGFPRVLQPSPTISEEQV